MGAATRRPLAALWQKWRAHGHSHGEEMDGPTVKVTFVYEKVGGLRLSLCWTYFSANLHCSGRLYLYTAVDSIATG